jgi:hypothetical protein
MSSRVVPGLAGTSATQKANELCPSGYTTLSEDAGFNRKEMHIACPGQSAKP